MSFRWRSQQARYTYRISFPCETFHCPALLYRLPWQPFSIFQKMILAWCFSRSPAFRWCMIRRDRSQNPGGDVKQTFKNTKISLFKYRYMTNWWTVMHLTIKLLQTLSWVNYSLFFVITSTLGAKPWTNLPTSGGGGRYRRCPNTLCLGCMTKFRGDVWDRCNIPENLPLTLRCSEIDAIFWKTYL